MNDISFFQIFSLTCLAILRRYRILICQDYNLSKPAISGFLAGIIMGDINTGLLGRSNITTDGLRCRNIWWLINS